MVELLFESKPTPGGAGGQGAHAALSPSAPFLKLPRWIPVRAVMKGAPILPSGAHGDWSEHEGLSSLAHSICGDFFGLKVQIFTEDNGNLAYVDPHASGVTVFCVGPRVELLEKYYGAGQYLLGLMQACPFWVMTPDEIMDWASGHIYGWEREAEEVGGDGGERRTLDVPWWPSMVPDARKRPKKLPPKLTEIVDAIEREPVRRGYHMEWPDVFESFPIGMATWHDTRPYQNKLTKRRRTWGMPEENGSCPAWMALDHMVQQTMETGNPSSCHPPHHNIDELERGFRALARYTRLFKYLSHEDKITGFNMLF